jgi:hypothetical protein
MKKLPITSNIKRVMIISFPYEQGMDNPLILFPPLESHRTKEPANQPSQRSMEVLHHGKGDC